MKALKTLAAAGLIASSLALAPAGAQAQSAAADPGAGSGFDGYRVLAVTAGVIAGAAVAAIVTDGLIIPAYAYIASGSGAATGGMAAAEGAAAGGGAAGMGAARASGWGGGIAHAGYQAFRGGMRILGAVGGGFYADSWYTGR